MQEASVCKNYVGGHSAWEMLSSLICIFWFCNLVFFSIFFPAKHPFYCNAVLLTRNVSIKKKKKKVLLVLVLIAIAMHYFKP